MNNFPFCIEFDFSLDRSDSIHLLLFFSVFGGDFQAYEGDHRASRDPYPNGVQSSYTLKVPEAHPPNVKMKRAIRRQ